MKKLLTTALLAATLAQTALAGDLSQIGTLSTADFRTVSEDLGAALSYKPIAPTENQGLTGFDIGVEVTGTDISKSTTALKTAGAGNSSLSTLVVSKLHVHKGLPLGIDIGAFMGNVSDINLNLVGAELRYAVIQGGIAMPAVGVRGAYTKTNGSDQYALQTRSLDLSISKGFAMLTPYAGIGQVWVDSTRSTGSSESFSVTKYFAGANINMGLLNLALEADQTGKSTSWGVKAGVRW